MNEIRNLDLNLLVVFESIYTAGNITHAAKSLGLSQPTISNALSRLRTSMDDPLFIRSNSGVVPTSRAMQIVGPIRDALQLISEGVLQSNTFDPATTKRHFRIALVDYLEPLLIPPIVKLIQDHKSVSLEAVPLSTIKVSDGLNDGSLDLVISTFLYQSHEISCLNVGPADVVVIARIDHPKISTPISPEQFAQLGHIALNPALRRLSKIEEQLSRLGIERHIVYTATKMWSFPYIVANTDLIGLLPGNFARMAAESYPIYCHPVPFELPEQHSFITWKKGREKDEGLAWLISKLSEIEQLSI